MSIFDITPVSVPDYRRRDVFQREIATAMALMGVNRIEDITPDLIES